MFTELLNNNINNPEFSFVVSKSKFTARNKDGLIPSIGQYVIIGIASYNLNELKLLDEINNNYLQWEKTCKIEVFDFASLTDMKDVNYFIPPLIKVTTSPVISVWNEGKSILTGSSLFNVKDNLKKMGILQ